MRRILASISVSLLLGACSGSDTSTPQAACTSAAAAVCNKAGSCNDLGNVSVSDCTTTIEAEANCATAACPTGQTFNSGAASQCLSDINGLSCTDASNDFNNGTFPSSCSNVCH
jgi:uncharacterized protein (UPF0333 family)